MGGTVLPQNILISELSKINQAYPRIEKVLIVPDYQTGHQILEYAVRSGVSWLTIPGTPYLIIGTKGSQKKNRYLQN